MFCLEQSKIHNIFIFYSNVLLILDVQKVGKKINERNEIAIFIIALLCF